MGFSRVGIEPAKLEKRSPPLTARAKNTYALQQNKNILLFSIAYCHFPSTYKP